jgi:branched-chain amino acid transport system permease protein
MTLPAGVYAETYEQDRALIRTRAQWLWFIAFMICLFLLPVFGGGRLLGIMNMIGIMVISVVGLQLNVGYGGQINLGQSAFMGIGAYTVGALALHFNFPIFITIPLAGIIAASFGGIFGVAAARIKGFYLALTTIAAQYIFSFIAIKLPKQWLGQEEGIRIEPASLFGFELDTDISISYLILSIAVLMIYGAYGIARSKIGRNLLAIRDNDNAAEIIGIDVFYYKLLSFLMGAFYAGIAGSLWSYYVRYVSVDQFSLWISVWYLGMLIVGGMGSILGAIIGTVAIRLLQEFITYLGPIISEIEIFSEIGGYIIYASMNILLGGIIIIFVIFEPRGLAHRWGIFKESCRIWPFPY